MARLTIEFPQDYNDLLEKLARSRHTTKTEILRRAITSYDVLQEADDKGQQVMLIDDKNQTRTRIIIP